MYIGICPAKYLSPVVPVGDVRDNMLSTTRSHECIQADDDKKKLSVLETINQEITVAVYVTPNS